MEYSAIHDKFLISKEELRQATLELQYTMRQIRDMANVSMGKRKNERGLKDIDLIERGLINTAKILGINLGAEWGHEIDLTLD